MKQTIITVMLTLVCMAGQAQQLRMSEATFDDYVPLLNAKGYMAYSFDTKDIKGKQLEIDVMEYAGGKEVESSLPFEFSFSAGEKLVIGLAPSDADSVYVFSFQSDKGEGITGKLMLKPVLVPEEPAKQIYIYKWRPFELVPTADAGKFMPLVLFGSYWWDADSGVLRFCGDNVVKPDLSSDIIEHIPHFYILGIKIQ